VFLPASGITDPGTVSKRRAGDGGDILRLEPTLTGRCPLPVDSQRADKLPSPDAPHQSSGRLGSFAPIRLSHISPNQIRL